MIDLKYYGEHQIDGYLKYKMLPHHSLVNEQPYILDAGVNEPPVTNSLNKNRGGIGKEGMNRSRIDRSGGTGRSLNWNGWVLLKSLTPRVVGLLCFMGLKD